MNTRTPTLRSPARRPIRSMVAVGAASLFILSSAVALFADELRRVPNTFHNAAASDSADVVAAVAAYHGALAAGDSVAALALLAPDAVILESGGIETRDEYRSHHLAGDIGFARAVKSERGPVRVVLQGDIAWATSTNIAQGDYRGRQINSASAELMVLSRSTRGWQIRAIHWSSRPRRQ